jgi:hypothetical protein
MKLTSRHQPEMVWDMSIKTVGQHGIWVLRIKLVGRTGEVVRCFESESDARDEAQLLLDVFGLERVKEKVA